jgi:FAD/FMN-containing dehydrogenase
MTAPTTAAETARQELEGRLQGRLIGPLDYDYDEARAVYNGAIDKRPALIARCTDTADVTAALRFGRDHGLDMAIRGGGHSGPGFGVIDGGLVIDLSPMRWVRVDPEAKLVQVGGGARLKELDHATHAFGLATPTGIFSVTGVGGLILGGGHGHLSRRYGLTIDNLVEADVVLADGSLERASRDRNEDLFWAIRGGGGNFGVVTSFTFRLYPVHTVGVGITFWPIEQTRKVLRWYREFLPGAPEDLTGFFAVLVVPPGPPFPAEIHNRKVAAVVWCHTGEMERLESALDPARHVGTPLMHMVTLMPYPALQSMFDPLMPPGLQWYWRGDLFDRIPDAAIDIHLEYGSRIPTPLSTMHLYALGGAVGRVAEDETAWSHRGALWSAVYGGIDPDPARADEIRRWCVGYQQALHPHSMGGSYVNFMGDEGKDRIRATYRGNYQRLARIKAKFDPDNVFHVNQNIEPHAARA